MRKHALILMVLGFLFMSGTVLAQSELSRRQIEDIAQTVVQIVTLDNRGDPISAGSGTIIDATGMILTNRHVIDGGSDFAILTITDMREQPELTFYASLVGVSSDIDLAVLQIDRDENGDDINPARLDLPYMDATNMDVAHGDRIYIFGFPDIGDGYLVVTQGSITTIEADKIGRDRVAVWYQTDAEISPGNSGGLAVNTAGEFIGIPTAVRTDEATLGRLGGITPYEAIQVVLKNEGLDTPRRQNSSSDPENQRRSDADLVGGVSVDCGDASFENGIAFTVIQMRAGFTYTATAIGIDGFDPVLAVYDPKTGRGQCIDDVEDAAVYEAHLPTTGDIRADETTAQINFSQNSGRSLADVTIVVGGWNNAEGEFILILEGMAVTQYDGVGDPFSVILTPGMVGHGTPLTVYMIGINRGLDPFMFIPDQDWNILETSDGDLFACDNAGSRSCWGDSEPLSGYYVSRTSGRIVESDDADAMMSLPIDGFTDVTMDDPFYIYFAMTSANQRTTGDYTIIFHAGTR